jgi:hypothetical protein
MTKIDKSKLQDIGLRKYFKFVDKITDKEVMTPHTSLLLELSQLDEREDYFVFLVLTELLKNFREFEQ